VAGDALAAAAASDDGDDGDDATGIAIGARRPAWHDALAEQSAALQVCEHQFAEATRDCERIFAGVPTEPQAAREQSEALTRAFVDKMLDAPELCIRVLLDD